MHKNNININEICLYHVLGILHISNPKHIYVIRFFSDYVMTFGFGHNIWTVLSEMLNRNLNIQKWELYIVMCKL